MGDIVLIKGAVHGVLLAIKNISSATLIARLLGDIHILLHVRYI